MSQSACSCVLMLKAWNGVWMELMDLVQFGVQLLISSPCFKGYRRRNYWFAIAVREAEICEKGAA